MFLSNLVIDAHNRKVRRELHAPYELHRTLMNAYPYARAANRCDLLFRVESHRAGPPTLLVQTRDDPAGWSNLPAGYLLHEPDCKPLELAVAVGQRLRFRLRANPTKRVAAANERLGAVMAGKRVALHTEADQLRWLLHKAELSGFRIPGEWLPATSAAGDATDLSPDFRVEVVTEGRDRNGKPGHGGEFLAVRFEGVLVVTEADRFQSTISTGIGSAKAFGFGLLSVAPG